MPHCYSFGVEIEAIVEPHNRGQPVKQSTDTTLRVWYEKLAVALRNRTGVEHLRLNAEESLSKDYHRRSDRNLKWWITWDGSLAQPSWPEHPGGKMILDPKDLVSLVVDDHRLVPLEAVSPKLSTLSGMPC